VNHKGQHSHLGGTALVQFNGTLGKLGLLIEGVPAQVEGTISEVTGEFGGSSHILHDGKLQKSNKGSDLQSTGNGDGERRIPAVSQVRELGSIVRDVACDFVCEDEIGERKKPEKFDSRRFVFRFLFTYLEGRFRRR